MTNNGEILLNFGKRKIIAIAGYSYALIIPKVWITSNKLTNKMKDVDVKMDGEGRLIITKGDK